MSKNIGINKMTCKIIYKKFKNHKWIDKNRLLDLIKNYKMIKNNLKLNF